ncbi:MAG: lysozyme inhibitor LprI family protein [Acidimicrobiales bacterium]
MRRLLLAVVLAVVAGTIGLGTLWGAPGRVADAAAPHAAAPRAAAPHAAVPPLKPPVIVEPFTLLPCNAGTTIGMEGCAEHRIIAADKRIDREIRILFAVLHDNAARRRLAEAQTAWFLYRQADCRSQADINEGGSQSVVDAAICAVTDDKSRSTDLRDFYRALEQGRQSIPAFP